MIKIRVILHLLAVSAGLLANAREHENGDGSYLISYETSESSPWQSQSQYDSEVASAQAIFRDLQFTRSLRESEFQQSERHLVTDSNDGLDVCLPLGETCSGNTDCCRGGCNSQDRCFCQAPGGLCFKPGQSDNYCCSNRCKWNGQCACIAAGASCTVGDGLCCEGYACGTSGTCVKEKAEDRSTCAANGNVCFNDGTMDDDCCSKFCGSNGRCAQAPTRKPTPAPTSSVLGFTSKADLDASAPCSDPKMVKLTIEVKTDKFGSDVGWSIQGYHSKTLIDRVVKGTYGIFDNDQVDLCVLPGLYNFTVTDDYGDGVCCMQGDGHIKVYLNYREVLYLSSYGKVVSEILNVGFDPSPSMSTRDYQYLDAHNRRRFAWYTQNFVSDVPLVWSPRLAEESRVWAEELLVNCSIAGIEHEHGVDEGENLAKNTGGVSEDGSGWGQVSEQSSFAFDIFLAII
jgi:hypothetical protein